MTAGRSDASPEVLHIFVYVVRSRHDHFAGLKARLAEEATQRIADVRFTPAEFDHIDKVEYTERRFFRAFYYRAIFRRLVAMLDEALANLGDEPATVYFSDEGVWAVAWAAYRRRLSRAQVRSINVQHGFALLRPGPFGRLRRAINAVSMLFTGFPTIGYGSLGGAGPEPFDLYLTYDEPIAARIRGVTGRAALPAPHLIKHELIEAFAALPRKQGGITRALFAMNVKMRGSPVKCDAPETFDQLMGLAAALDARGARLVLRLHPGMDREATIRSYEAHPIARLTELDANGSLNETMAQADLVLSFVSTVLWEGSLLGLLPVQVVCACCDQVELGFEREILSLDGDFPPKLDALLARARARHGRDWQACEGAEWAAARSLIVQ